MILEYIEYSSSYGLSNLLHVLCIQYGEYVWHCSEYVVDV